MAVNVLSPALDFICSDFYYINAKTPNSYPYTNDLILVNISFLLSLSYSILHKST